MYSTSHSSSLTCINISASCDENYAQHLGIMFLSVLRNSHNTRLLQFFLIDNGISHVSITEIKNLVESFGAKITIIEAQEKPFEHIETGRYGAAAYQRLIMAEILPANIGQVVYLDSDLIVIDDIYKLAVMAGDAPLAAIENLSPKACLSIGLRRNSYFNSGVLVANLDYWRTHSIQSKLLSYLRDNKDTIRHLDQCALNGVFEDKWARIPQRWNLQADAFGVLKKYYDNNCGYSKQELTEAIASPAIIHFIGPKKPWLWKCHSEYKVFYDHYKSLSPWKDCPRQDSSLGNTLKSSLALRKRYRQWSRYRNLNIHPNNIG